MKLITVNRHRVNTLRRSLGQRSRSPSDGHRNLVNAIASDLLQVFAPKLAHKFPTVEPQTDWVFKVMSLKVKVRSHETFSAKGILVNGLQSISI